MAPAAEREIRKMSPAAVQTSPVEQVKLPLTINEAAELWGVSRTTVRKWIAHGRVRYERRGGGESRAAAILIFQRDRPKRLAPGSLSEQQRKAWRHR